MISFYDAVKFASDADDVFQVNLVRQFGHRAWAARYDTARKGWDARTTAAHAAKLAADQSVHAAFYAR